MGETERGGSMSSGSNDFQFELNETLYFDRGEEVNELIGISLNPEISIHSYDTYVSIRGEIELKGEYVREESSSEDEDDFTFDDLEAKRYVAHVDKKEDNLTQFTHRFPVDISIPTYRIENMDDVRIQIVDFDYELPMNSKLQLTALAEIQGIMADEDLLEKKTQLRERDEEDALEELQPFSFEIKRKEMTDEETAKLEVDSVNSREEAEEMEQKETRTDGTEDELQEEQPENEWTIRAREEGEEGEESEAEEEKDISYLTDIFRDTEEESYTRMKICIAQENDTIESIAERFQISALQLIKLNKLDDDFEISEGQLLYIPQK